MHNDMQTTNAGAMPHHTTPTPHAQLLATSTVDELAAALNELRLRGVTNPDEFASLDAAVIRDTVRWFDGQGDRVTAGVLVLELRKGGRKPQRSVADEQREYADSIVSWLNQHFPEFQQRLGNPHPAAVAAVIRLHYRDGKGNLTVRKHGGEVRAAVKAWRLKWDEPTEREVV